MKQTAGRDKLGALAPKFAELNDDVLFGEVWSREDKLNLRDRSLITISSLMSQGLFPQLKSHIKLGKDHGISKSEIIEVVTQLAFYCGWPKAWQTFSIIEEIYGSDDNSEAKFELENVFGKGNPNTAYAKYFIGDSYLKALVDEKCPLHLSNVTFKPGCRNNWHIHHSSKDGGQILICTAGSGWYQEYGKDPISLMPGDVIVIPANVKHFHGAKKDMWFSHIALEVPGENTSNEWLEEVSCEYYNKLGE